MKTLVIQFKNEIEQKELPLFRGAIISTMEDANILFHNHDHNKLRYSYPLIQYKRFDKKAAIVCIEKGTEAISGFFSSCNFDIHLGRKNIKLEIESVKGGNTPVQIENEEFTYRIHSWIPFNHDNYKQFQQVESLVEKYATLERILVGNILSFLKGVDIYLDKQIVCKIINIEMLEPITYKTVSLMAFNIDFKCNVSLPDYIGLGKNVSLGNGTLMRRRTSIRNKE